MAEVTQLNEKIDTQTIKPMPKSAPKGKFGGFVKKAAKSRSKKKSEFSRMDKILIWITSFVAFGGVVFCTVMLILMTSISY